MFSWFDALEDAKRGSALLENPYDSPAKSSSPIDENPQTLPPDQVIYNVVVDTVTGVNTRWSDNVFQAIFVFATVAIAALIGAILAAFNPRWNLPWFGGALFGSVIGLILGILTSGAFLMVYRASRHMKGKHD